MVNLNVESQQLRETARPRAGHIEIPLALRDHPVSLLPISSRLSGVFKRAKIKVLGDLHGRSHYDFALHRNCGSKTMKELEALIHLARHCDERTLFGADAIPFPSSVLTVPPSRADLRFVDLPISKRLYLTIHKIGIDRLGDLNGRNAIQLQEHPKLRIERLGDLDGRSLVEFLAYPGVGQRTVAEIKHLVARAAAHEFTALEIDESEKVPELLHLIETSIERLHPAEWQIFLEKIGYEDRPLLTVSDLGKKQGVTREAIRLTIEKVVVALRKSWGPRIPVLLDIVKDRCTAGVCPLTPELLCFWSAGRDARFKLSLRMHVRIISELDKAIPAWPNGYEGGGTFKKKNRDFARHVAEILRSANGHLSFAQVFSQLTYRAKYSHWSVQTFLQAIRRMHGMVGVDCAVPQIPVLHLIAK